MSIVWPDLTCVTFEDAVNRVLHTCPGDAKIIISEGEEITLLKTILIKQNSAKLTIIGDGTRKPKVIGLGHSIFQIGGRNARLKLVNLDLFHNCVRECYKDIGACVFALNLAKIEVTGCNIRSTHGFGLWAVQRASFKVSDCNIVSDRRSGCVSFGKSRVDLDGCIVENCGIHGVCTRGNTQLCLRRCKIANCESRGVYAYHSADVYMEECTVSGTKRRDLAAVDMFSSTPIEFRDPSRVVTDCNSTADINGDDTIETFENQTNMMSTSTSSNAKYKNGQGYTKHVVEDIRFRMIRCCVQDNHGIGVKIKSDAHCSVQHSFIDCTIENNQGGNISIVTEEENGIAAVCEALCSTSLCDEKDRSTGFDGTRCIWEYEVDDSATPNERGGFSYWNPYSKECNEYLESNYRLYCHTKLSESEPTAVVCPVTLPGTLQDYEVDFELMVQSNKCTFYSRSVRRRSI